MKRNLINLAIFAAVNITMAATSLAVAKEISNRHAISSEYKVQGTSHRIKEIAENAHHGETDVY